MKSHQLYCGACDKHVRVLISEALPGEHQATVHDDEVICLEIGSNCTGNMCPLGAAEPNAMVARLIHEGLPTDSLHTVKATCPSCGLDADFVLYGRGKASCTVCGTAARWEHEHIEPSA